MSSHAANIARCSADRMLLYDIGNDEKQALGQTSLSFGGREGIRTLDLSVANAALSQLSYAPTAGTDCRGTNYEAPFLAPVPPYLENITRGPLSAVCLGGPN